MPTSTIPARCGLPDHDQSPIDGVTGEPLSRYGRDHPGSLTHVDVTKFVNIPTAVGGAQSASPAG
jgi:hypothetical protein